MYRLHGAIHAYGGTTVSARDTADSVISALTPAAWYRNATGVTSAGGFASQWDDYSGNARHLVQATGTNQPAYSAGVFTFDGADNRMVATSWGLVQPTTIILVVNMVSWTDNDWMVDGTAGANTGSIYQTAATPRFYLFAGWAVGPNTTLAVGSRGVLCAVFNGASSRSRVNNASPVTGNVGASNMGGVVIGCQGSLINYANMTLEEAVIFDSAVSDANLDAVVTALNDALTVF